MSYQNMTGQFWFPPKRKPLTTTMKQQVDATKKRILDAISFIEENKAKLTKRKIALFALCGISTVDHYQDELNYRDKTTAIGNTTFRKNYETIEIAILEIRKEKGKLTSKTVATKAGLTSLIIDEYKELQKQHGVEIITAKPNISKVSQKGLKELKEKKKQV